MTNMLSNRLKIDVLRIKFNCYLYKSKISDSQIKECNNNRPQRIQVEFHRLIKKRGLRDLLDPRHKIWLVQLDKRAIMVLQKEMN